MVRRLQLPTSSSEDTSPEAATSAPTNDSATTRHPSQLAPQTADPVAHPVPSKTVAVELADLFSHAHSLRSVKGSCEFYGIHVHDDHLINKARLSLHITGITCDSVGEEMWKKVTEELASFIGTCRMANDMTTGRWNEHGPILFPNAWIPCIDPVEALRQCIKRLLDHHQIPIPQDSLDLRGMEGPRMPTFNLRGCFEHLLSAEEDKLTRFLYIEKALSCWGVYPKDPLFQKIGAFLGKILTGPVITQKATSWDRVRLLKSLGMGIEIKKDDRGKPTLNCILHPWGIELKPPYDIDFFVSLWLGGVIASDFVKGQRRTGGPSELDSGPEIDQSLPIEEGEFRHDDENNGGLSCDGIMEQGKPFTPRPLASTHSQVHRGHPAALEVGPPDAMLTATPRAIPSKSTGKLLASSPPPSENDQHKRARTDTTAMNIDQLLEDDPSLEDLEIHGEEE